MDTATQLGAETWLNELIWREFYAAILYHFPFVRQMAFRPKLREISWRDAPADFAAWVDGRTGYPVVDAAMRITFEKLRHRRIRSRRFHQLDPRVAELDIGEPYALLLVDARGTDPQPVGFLEPCRSRVEAGNDDGYVTQPGDHAVLP
jgi:hypothetical protein